MKAELIAIAIGIALFAGMAYGIYGVFDKLSATISSAMQAPAAGLGE